MTKLGSELHCNFVVFDHSQLMVENLLTLDEEANVCNSYNQWGRRSRHHFGSDQLMLLILDYFDPKV